ncbi:NAD(P)/FAD-dependent oxidoreductase [Rickettsiales bacterium]|nr:NAD(P)/FAD-dependent oxidoreductase [Rickettsiales bacterium]
MKNIETDVLIIGAGPVGLFCVFELGQLGIKSTIIDSLSEIGGQCTALYPEKPIYDIPAYPEISASDLIENIQKQISPFKPSINLDEKVEKLSQLSELFIVKTNKNRTINAKCIIIAAGSGAFGPNKPPLENLSKFEDKSVFYSVKDKSIFKEKNLVIAGGGDSAVDWGIELAETANKIYFVHRRKKLRAAPNSVKNLEKLSESGRVEMVIPFQIDSITGQNGFLNEVIVRDLNDKKRFLKADYFLPFYGLSSDLGPIKEWELEISNNNLEINQSSCETSTKGIFAIGDVCNYSGKLKLILTGFSEAAIAAQSCYKKIFPDKTLHFEYSTTKGINKI